MYILLRLVMFQSKAVFVGNFIGCDTVYYWSMNISSHFYKEITILKL